MHKDRCLDSGAFKFILITACILFCFISLLGSAYHIKNCKEIRKLLVLTGIIVKECYLLNLKYSAQ